MNTPVPSRAALRALRRLCSNAPSSTQPCVVNLYSVINSSNAKPNKASQSHRNYTTTVPIRSTTKTTIHKQPEAASASKRKPDPQAVSSSPPLPDISSYYTLFPETLPHGPPRGPPSSSSLPTSAILSPDSPASSSPTASDPSQAKFDIPVRDLRKEFLHLQSLHHPDKFPSDTPAHQKAYALSTLLNNAYKTLSDPLLRAQYLLQELYDIDVTSEDNNSHSSAADTELLMTVMEVQEELENCETEAQKDRLKEDNDRRVQECVEELARSFERGDKEQAVRGSVRLKFWRGVDGALRDWEPGKKGQEVRLVH